jgi:hypothetical protein
MSLSHSYVQVMSLSHSLLAAIAAQVWTPPEPWTPRFRSKVDGFVPRAQNVNF